MGFENPGRSMKAPENSMSGLGAGIRQFFPRGLGPRLVLPEINRLLPRVIVFAVLVASAGLEDGVGHGHSHWLLLVGYLAVTAATALRPFRSSTVGLWTGTLLDAGLAGYVLIEHLVVRGAVPVGDTVSQLPAFLLLLQTSLSLRLDRTAAFSVVVVLVWAGGIALSAAVSESGRGTTGHQLFGLLAFIAASAFVLDGVARVKRALAAALTAERERSFLSRFVSPGTDLGLVGSDGRATIRRRHACLLSVDIRGFSELSRRHPSSDVLRWLLVVRSTVNEAVTAHHGVVDKYVGDGVLAQFFEGAPERQARAALAAALAVKKRLEEINTWRAQAGLPALRLVIALHAGEVLAGVLDDGMRAELTVLGPAMNALSRIERRAKNDNLDVLASKRFSRLLGPNLPSGLVRSRLARRDADHDAPDVVSLTLGGSELVRSGSEPHPEVYA